MIFSLLMSVALAETSQGFQLEFYPQSTLNSFAIDESLDHPLSLNQLQWIPWGVTTFETWSMQYTILPRVIQSTSRTTESKELQRIGHTILGMDVEKNWTSDDLHWAAGVGLLGNIPSWKIQSSLFTDEENEDIDSQSSVQRSEIRQMGIRLPINTSYNIHNNVKFGIGLVPIWMLRWAYSDYSVQWTHHLDITPTMSIEFTSNK